MRASSSSILVLLLAAAYPLNGQTTAVYIPATPAEAISNLHRSQAEGLAWSEYGVGTTLTFQVTVIDEYGRQTKFKQNRILLNRLNGRLDVAIDETKDGERTRSVQVDVEDRPELYPDKAKKLQDEDVLLGKKIYKSSVYTFHSLTHHEGGSQTMDFTYWVAGGVPNGVLKLRIVSTGTHADDQFDVVSRLTGWDVPLSVAGKPVLCYCRENSRELEAGVQQVIKSCRSPNVPGSFVLYEQTVTEGTKRVRRIERLVDYKIVKRDDQ